MPLRAPKLQRWADDMLERLRRQFDGTKKRKFDLIDAAQLHNGSSTDYHRLVPADLKAVISEMSDKLQQHVSALSKKK